jgi:hypothetical protein
VRCSLSGIKEVDDGIRLASFMHYDLGYFDLEQKTLQPLDNPFGTRLSPMSWVHVLKVRGVTYLSGPDTSLDLAEPEGFEPSIGLYNPITV